MALVISYTGQALVDQIRNTVGDPPGAASPRWQTNPDIIGYANRGMVKTHRDLETLLETSWNATMVQSQESYTAPISFTTDTLVELVMAADDKRFLTYLTREQWKELVGRDPTQEGIPQYYKMWRKQGADLTVKTPTAIHVWPVADSTAASKTLRVEGYKMPDEITNATLANVVECDAEYIEAVIFWACSLMKSDDDNDRSSTRFAGQYAEEIRRLKGMHAKKTRSKRPRIVPRRNSALVSRDIPPWKPLIWGG